jgi:hypothetical protein
MQLARLFAAAFAAWLGACAAAPRSVSGPPPAARGAPPPIAMPHRTGDVHDFDFLAGGWTVQNRGRKSPADAWTEFPSTACLWTHLGGVLNVDQFDFPTKGYSGASVRVFQLENRQWSIYWVQSIVGTLLPPAVGGFEGDRGEFFSVEELDGKPVLYRLLWLRLDPDHARWEQAYSFDGKDWIPNWVMELTRTAPAGGC